MDRLLARLELRLGRFAIPDLTLVIVIGMALVFALALAQPQVLPELTLDLAQVREGQVWRLVTYLFIPPASSPLWVFFALYMTYFAGTALEREWGAFKFNVFYLAGMVGTTIVAALVGGAVGNLWLNASLFLAFATLFPELELTLFFVLPVRVKWLGWIAGCWMLWRFVSGDLIERAAILAGLGNYLLFFGGRLPALLRRQTLVARQASLRDEHRGPEPREVDRTCAICGARESEGADIRVCNCEKCGGKLRTLCLEHARNH